VPQFAVKEVEMSMPDGKDIILESLAQDVNFLKDRMGFLEMMLAQVIGALAEANIISIEEEEEEDEKVSRVIIP
jgi:hypothetical protein